MDRLRIAQVAPPLEQVPPRAYGGTERVVHALVQELVRRGHEVTTFASGDSDVPGRLVPTVPRALWPAGFMGDASPFFAGTMVEVLRHARDFDIVHSHLEWYSLILMRSASAPVVSTFHGRLDLPGAGPFLRDPPPGLVAISRSQASVHPDVPWEVVHNGLDLSGAPFDLRRGDDLCFVGRATREKGILDAIEIARISGRRLRIAAKISSLPDERAYWDEVVQPAMKEADVEFLGELSHGDRDRLLAESYASLMPGAWPEPFGLVAIESLACGTPLLARRVGALPEIVRDGIDGFLGDDAMHLAFLLERIEGLDRAAIRASVLERFSASRMADRYEAVYGRRLALARAASADSLGAPIVTARFRAAEASPAHGLAHRPGLPSMLPLRGRGASDAVGGSRPRPTSARIDVKPELGGVPVDGAAEGAAPDDPASGPPTDMASAAPTDVTSDAPGSPTAAEEAVSPERGHRGGTGSRATTPLS